MNAKLRYLDFFRVVGKSKRIPRTGWVREKVKNPESVAEHSFRVSVIAMVIADKLGLDKEKLMKMALIHDLGETYIGDVVWTRGELMDMKAKEEKEKKELYGIMKLFSLIDDSDNFPEIFKEMIDLKSREAKVFKQIDRLEMAIQALEYEEDQGVNLEEFFLNAGIFIKEPLLKEIFEEILSQRTKKTREEQVGL